MHSFKIVIYIFFFFCLTHQLLYSSGENSILAGNEEEQSVLYWVNRHDVSIIKSDTDGNNASIILMNVDSPAGVTLDRENGYIYWIRYVEFGTKSINRARIGGGDYSVLINTGMHTPERIAVDSDAGYMFWTDSGHNHVMRADLDGSNSIELVSDLSLPLAIALDPENEMVYWSNSDNIERMNYDGTSREVVVNRDDGLWSARGLAVDSQNERIFWIDTGIHTGDSFIYSINLDGGDMQTVLSGISRSVALDITIDPVNNHIYYTSSASSPRGVYRVNYDGTGNGAFTTFGLGNTVINMVYDAARESLYWSQVNRHDLFSMNSSSQESGFALPRVDVPNHIIVDTENDMLYWSTTTRSIFRSSTDGTLAEEIVSKPDYLNINDLALDPVANKLYFTYEGFSDYRIGRVNLDGSESEDVFESAMYVPYAIDLDVENGYIYWSDRTRTDIYRSDLDGEEWETILSGQQLVITEIKLDLEGEKVYWASAGGNVIKRANLDGTEDEILHEDLNNTRSLSLDHTGGYLYFADENGLYRSALDGSDRVTLVDGIWAGAVEVATGSLPTSVIASDDLAGRPEEYVLYQNYPNPFNPSTVIRYSIPELSHVRLEVFNMLGQRVALLVDEIQDTRFYEATWHANHASGMYFYRLEAVPVHDGANSFVRMNSMLLVK